MQGQGFRIDVDVLYDVAADAADLVDRINSPVGTAGNLADFREARGIAAPLATFWGSNQNVFDLSLVKVHHAILRTYEQMSEQLQGLERTIRNTAASYERHEQDSRVDISRAAESGGP